MRLVMCPITGSSARELHQGAEQTFGYGRFGTRGFVCTHGFAAGNFILLAAGLMNKIGQSWINTYVR
jgi:hypothetical protein